MAYSNSNSNFSSFSCRANCFYEKSVANFSDCVSCALFDLGKGIVTCALFDLEKAEESRRKKVGYMEKYASDARPFFSLKFFIDLHLEGDQYDQELVRDFMTRWPRNIPLLRDHTNHFRRRASRGRLSVLCSIANRIIDNLMCVSLLNPQRKPL